MNKLVKNDITDNELYNIKKRILLNIKKMNKNEYIQIFKIIKEYNIDYTENVNGIFINLNYIDKKIIIKINNFINFIISKNKELNEKEKEMNTIKNKLNN